MRIMEELVGLFERDEEQSPVSLPPEVEEGNVEYKLKLVNPSVSRFEHLVTQMKWRLREGEGEAIYQIGVEDNGSLAGLRQPDLTASLCTLGQMADRLGAAITVLREQTVRSKKKGPPRKVCEVLVRKIPDHQTFTDLRVAVLGNVDVGKSTLIGVLTQNEVDNGRGRARLNLFRHLHEIQTGRTSSISHEVLGFDENGQVLNFGESRTIEDICETASKLITFIDLAGHHKYLRTTIFGLTGYKPDFAMIIVGANTGLVGTTREHLGLALALEVPVFIVINKIDLCSESVVVNTIFQLERILKSTSCNKTPIRVWEEADAIMAAKLIHTCSIAPIFTVSCVSGTNLKILMKFLNLIPPSQDIRDMEKLTKDMSEFQIDETFNIQEVGTVVSGTLYKGIIRENDNLMLGPSENGSFYPIHVQSLHRYRTPCKIVKAGQCATIAIGNTNGFLTRRGMVLLSPEQQQQSCRQFEAEVIILFHSTSINPGFQATVHIGNVCQTVSIQSMDKECLRTNDKARIRFRFIKHPEYLRIGARVLMRQNKTKGIGQITAVFPDENDHKVITTAGHKLK